jgi:hypothetical protein
MTTTETGPPPGSWAFLRRLPSLNMKLSGVQTAVGLIAGVLSILGALQAMPNYFAPAVGQGGLVTVVVDAKCSMTARLPGTIDRFCRWIAKCFVVLIRPRSA